MSENKINLKKVRSLGKLTLRDYLSEYNRLQKVKSRESLHPKQVQRNQDLDPMQRFTKKVKDLQHLFKTMIKEESLHKNIQDLICDLIKIFQQTWSSCLKLQQNKNFINYDKKEHSPDINPEMNKPLVISLQIQKLCPLNSDEKTSSAGKMHYLEVNSGKSNKYLNLVRSSNGVMDQLKVGKNQNQRNKISVPRPRKIRLKEVLPTHPKLSYGDL